MQKTLRINLLARNQVLKRTHKKHIEGAKQEWKDYHKQKTVNERRLRQYVKEERFNRREDWIAGPLAPNRNAGTEKGVYGTINVDAIQAPDVPKSVAGGPKRPGYDHYDYESEHGSKLKFKGRTVVGNVVEGDRVCIVHGPERLRGLIGTVLVVDHGREEIRLQNINVADVRIPAGSPQAQGDPNDSDSPTGKALFNTMETPIPTTHVRLVQEIVLDNGEKRDVIIRHVHADGPYFQRQLGSNTPAHTRYVTGGEALNKGQALEIPWPDQRLEERFRKATPDTDRTLAEKSSWLPTVSHAPLGYDMSLERNLSQADNPSSPYTLGLVENPQEADNVQRAGLSGFTDQTRFEARQRRIAEGIMDELRNKTNRDNVQHDDSEWVKAKILEDARAIWWRDRKVVGPAVQAAERNVELRKKERDNRIIRDSLDRGVIVETLSDGVAVDADAEGRKTLAMKVALPAETEALVRDMQAINMRSIYRRPDQKFKKQLARLT